MTSRPALALLIASAIGGASCFSPSERSRTSAQAIIGGDADASHAAVLAIVQRGGTLCSGALVAPSLVLTAGHCVNGIAPADLQVLVGGDTSSPDQTVAVASVLPYPTFDSPEDAVPGGTDLGFVVLATPLSIPPLPIATDVADAALAKASVSVFGYGVDSGGEVVGSGVRREVVLTVSGVCARLFHAGDASRNVCEGDSGGPVILGGQIVAVVSGGQPGCTAPADFTRTDAHSVWIASVLAGSAGATCARCIEPDPSCTAATETKPAAPGDDAGRDAAATDGSAGGAVTVGGGCTLARRSEGRSGAFAALLGLALALCRRRRRGRAPTLPARAPPW